MRGADTFHEGLFTVRNLDDFVPKAHPLRPVRDQVTQALRRLDGLFSKMYADGALGGRPNIAQEKLVWAMLLQLFYWSAFFCIPLRAPHLLHVKAIK